MVEGIGRAFTLLVLSLALVGCGGSGPGGSSDVTPQAARTCLEEAGAEASTDDDDLDYVAMDAGVGAVYSDFGRNAATVVFERSESDAGQTAEAYRLFGATDEQLEERGSVLILWSKTPTDEESAAVDGCLE